MAATAEDAVIVEALAPAAAGKSGLAIAVRAESVAEEQLVSFTAAWPELRNAIEEPCGPDRTPYHYQ
jgi:hypothetical protein